MSLLHTYKRRRMVAPTTGGTTLVVLFYHMRARHWQRIKNTLWTLDPQVTLQTPTGREEILTQGGVRLLQCPTEALLPRVLAIVQGEPQALVVGAYAGDNPLDVYDLAHTGRLCATHGTTGDPLKDSFTLCVNTMQGGASLTQLCQLPQMTLLGYLEQHVSCKK
jgi:hypothetical protein